MADPAQAGSALSQGRQAARGGDGPCADPLEASKARSAAGAKAWGIEAEWPWRQRRHGAQPEKRGGASRRHVHTAL